MAGDWRILRLRREEVRELGDVVGDDRIEDLVELGLPDDVRPLVLGDDDVAVGDGDCEEPKIL